MGRCDIHRYVIIGSGAAGIAAAEGIRESDASGEIVLVADERHGYYSRPGLAYYLTGELNEKQLFPFREDDFQAIGVRRYHGQATKVFPGQKKVIFDGGNSLIYDRLLIATGASAARSSTPGSELNGVFKLDNLEDARSILKAAGRRRSAVVIGGGITALELVEGLVARGVKTHYLLRKDRYWNNVLDETESRIVEERLFEHGVKIHYHTEVAEILGDKGRVFGVQTQNGERIHCDIVCIAIGVRPRIGLAKVSGLQVERGILVNEYLQSSETDIYAAGDVAQVYDPFTGKSIVDSLWGPARDQGFTAGLNMSGEKTAYLKPVAFNVTRLAGLTTTIIGTVGRGVDEDLVGIARGDSETWRQLPDAIAAQQDFDVNRLRIMLGESTILGAIVMGDQTLSHPLHTIIAEEVDISPIKTQLLAFNAPVADLIAEFWTSYKQAYVLQRA